ncbi:hypothetical protein ACFX2B_001219 [Malus domestica]
MDRSARGLPSLGQFDQNASRVLVQWGVSTGSVIQKANPAQLRTRFIVIVKVGLVEVVLIRRGRLSPSRILSDSGSSAINRESCASKRGPLQINTKLPCANSHNL